MISVSEKVISVGEKIILVNEQSQPVKISVTEKVAKISETYSKQRKDAISQ